MISRRVMRFFLCVFVSAFFTTGLWAGTDPVPENLSQMPWYDKTKDYFHRYDPSEIELREEAKRGKPFGLPAIGMSAEFIRGLLIAALAAAVAFAIYAAARFFVGRRRDVAPAANPGRVHYLAHTEDEAPKRRHDPWKEFDIALAEGRFREAAAFLYGIAVTHFQSQGAIPEGNSLTARDLIRAFRSPGAEEEEVKKLFSGIARVYEAAVYAEVEPPVDLLRTLRISFPDIKRS